MELARCIPIILLIRSSCQMTVGWNQDWNTNCLFCCCRQQEQWWGSLGSKCVFFNRSWSTPSLNSLLIQSQSLNILRIILCWVQSQKRDSVGGRDIVSNSREHTSTLYYIEFLAPLHQTKMMWWPTKEWYSVSGPALVVHFVLCLLIIVSVAGF